jgi:hypothetical protein
MPEENILCFITGFVNYCNTEDHSICWCMIIPSEHFQLKFHFRLDFMHRPWGDLKWLRPMNGFKTWKLKIPNLQCICTHMINFLRGYIVLPLLITMILHDMPRFRMFSSTKSQTHSQCLVLTFLSALNSPKFRTTARWYRPESWRGLLPPAGTSGLKLAISTDSEANRSGATRPMRNRSEQQILTSARLVSVHIAIDVHDILIANFVTPAFAFFYTSLCRLCCACRKSTNSMVSENILRLSTGFRHHQ